MTKRFLSVLLTAVILLTALPLTVGAADSSVGAGLDLPVREATEAALTATGAGETAPISAWWEKDISAGTMIQLSKRII